MSPADPSEPPPSTTVPERSVPCPRCGAAVAAGQAGCPACGIDVALAAVLLERQALSVMPAEPGTPFVGDAMLSRFGEFLMKKGYVTAAQLEAKWGILFHLDQIHWLYYAEGLLILTAVLLVVISLLTPAPPKEKEKYTALGTTPEEKAASRASWNKWDVIHSGIIVAVVVAFYIYFW